MNLRKFLKTRQKAILITLIILFLFSSVFIVSEIFYWELKFLRFFYLFSLSGLPIVVLSKDFFKIKNWLSLFVYSAAISVLLIPLIFIIFAYITGIFNIYVIYSILGILSFFGIIMLVNNFSDIEVNKFERIRITDCINITILMLFYFLLIKMSLEQCNPAWDSFTFWAVDAKYIFENEKLRDSSFDLLSTFKYTSFLPILFSSIYFIYGKIVELFASSVNVYIGFISSLLLYIQFLNKKNFVKTGITIMLILTILYFIKYYLLYISLYSEIISAFFVLLFTILLITKTKKENNWFRILLILLTIVSIYFVKTHYWPISIVCFLIFLTYEISTIAQDKKKIEEYKNKNILLSIFIPISILFMQLYFLRDINWITGVIPEKAIGSFSENIGYIKGLFEYVQTIIIIPLLYFSSVLSIIFLRKPNKKIVTIFLISLLVIIPPLGLYILEKSVAFPSLNRYLSVAIYIPTLVFGFSFLDIKYRKKERFFDIVKYLFVLCSLVFLSVYELKEDFNLKLYVSPTEGNYDVCIGKWKDISNDTEKIIKDDTIMILNSEYEQIGNMNLPDIYVRYFLSENNVGGQYRVPTSIVKEEIEKVDPDYLLILEYDEYFEECNTVFEKDKTYLVKYNKEYICSEILKSW